MASPKPIYTHNPFGFQAHVWLSVTLAGAGSFNIHINVGSSVGAVHQVAVLDDDSVGRMVDIIATTGLGREEAKTALAASFALSGFGKFSDVFLDV